MLRDVQIEMLKIAKEVKRVCDENGIQYFLDSGTLLGAVRHKGFIPWDDDLDIGMMREEYDRFMEVAPSCLSSNYYLQTWDTDSGYPMPFAKVRKKGTVYLEAVAQYSRAGYELYVDIFPYDVYPSEKTQRIAQGMKLEFYKNILLMQCHYAPWNGKRSLLARIKSRMLYLPFMILSALFKRETIKRKYNDTMRLYNRHPTKYVYENGGASRYGKWVMPMECFESFIPLPFEDSSFSAPVGWDMYLKSAYGDYMTPPPEGKRENRHNILDVKL